MTLIEPFIGYLLSKYKETAEEGLQKIRQEAVQDTSFTIAFLNNHQAVDALKQSLRRRDLETSTVETLCVLAESCNESVSGSSAARSTLLREFIHDEPLTIFKKALSCSTDAGLPMCIVVLRFFSIVAKYVPKVLLARFNNQVPLHLACFRSQLPYSQRRLRLYRAQFFLRLATSRYMDPTEIILSHGFLTSLMEDAAELLLDGSAQGQAIGKEALRVLDEGFIRSRSFTAEQKRSRLLSQRNILRLLIHALDYPPVADEVIQVLLYIVTELKESPADYARNRVESSDDRGMPNYLLFLMLRQLRPKKSPKIVDLVTRILTAAPDLIRPYFARFSSHLVEDHHHNGGGGASAGGGAAAGGSGIAPATARVAILHLLTKIFLAPLPYHLTHDVATLNFSGSGHPSSGGATTSSSNSNSSNVTPDTFYHMSPKDVADEVCPQWLGEFAHKIINGSTDLLFLVLVMQMTQSAMYRATAVLASVRRIRQRMLRGHPNPLSSGLGEETGDAEHHTYDAVFQEAGVEEEWETFEFQVEEALLSALPKREEFWHRMTQQLHPMLLEQTVARGGAVVATALPKVEFIIQRMLLLMQSYSSVFRLRLSWISVIPHQLPTLNATQQQQLRQKANNGSGNNMKSYVSALLESDVDTVVRWNPGSISVLCSLLCCSMVNGVSMNKLHHINMSSGTKSGAAGLSEWPLLLRLMVWVTHHRKVIHSAGQPGDQEEQMMAVAVAWVARVVQWAVHGVTVSLGCSWDEVFLWLQVMRREAIPCFLHMLNHLLQRSLSKAADRVTLEFLQADHGVLVMAAEHFIAKTKEKQQEDASKGGDPTAKNTNTTTNNNNNKAKGKGRDGGSSSTHPTPVDVWVEDLKQHLGVFEEVVKEVRRRWNEREAIMDMYKRDVQQYSSGQPFGADTKRDDNQEVAGSKSKKSDKEVSTSKRSSDADSGSRGISSSSPATQRSTAVPSTVLVPSLEQWMRFRTTLRAPVAPYSNDEADLSTSLWSQKNASSAGKSSQNSKKKKAAAAVSDERSLVMGQLDQALGILESGGKQDDNESSASSSSAWYRMNALCWELSAKLLQALSTASAASPTTEEEEDEEARRAAVSASSAVFDLAQRVAQLMADHQKAIRTAHAESREEALVGFYFLVLVVCHLMLIAKSKKSTQKDNGEGAVSLTPAVSAAIEKIVRSTYRGTVSVVDRIRYASLLTLHYLEEKETERADEKDSQEDEDEEEEEASKHHSRSKAQASKKGVVVFHSAKVPKAFVDHRFMIWSHKPATYLTPEVDVLNFMTDLWTDQELLQMPLEMPSRLHNRLMCGSHDHHPMVSDVLLHLSRAIFPEVAVEDDFLEGVAATDSTATSSKILDPRYLLPLMQTVFALPREYIPRRFLGVRCFPFLLRSLSMTDPTLRLYAVAALSTVYLPPGPVKVVHSFARLKMIQLSQKKKFSEADLAGPPRLPAPLSALLVLSLKAIGRYDDPLHHHLMRFLIDTSEAFATPVPFHHWLTAFPLDAVGHPLMIQQQEKTLKLQHHGGGGLNNNATSAAEGSSVSAMEQFRKTTPPQLRFILRLLSFGCQTKGDAVALVESQSLQSLMLLSSLLTSSNELRLEMIQCLSRVCFSQSSSAVAVFIAQEGRVFIWLFHFLLQLCHEYGTSSALYAEPLFRTTMFLVTRLCVMLQHHGDRTTSDLLRHQVGDHIRLLRLKLVEGRITAKETLDMMARMEEVWKGMEHTESLERSRQPLQSSKQPRERHVTPDEGNRDSKRRRLQQ